MTNESVTFENLFKFYFNRIHMELKYFFVLVFGFRLIFVNVMTHGVSGSECACLC